MNQEAEQLFVIEQLKLLLDAKNNDISRLVRQIHELSLSHQQASRHGASLEEQNHQFRRIIKNLTTENAKLRAAYFDQSSQLRPNVSCSQLLTHHSAADLVFLIQ